MLLAGCHQTDFPAFPSNYREFAYISNGNTNTVTALDIVHIRPDRTIAVGRNPTGLAANPVTNEIYVVNSGSGTLSVLDAERNDVVATIPLGSSPYFSWRRRYFIGRK